MRKLRIAYAVGAVAIAALVSTFFAISSQYSADAPVSGIEDFITEEFVIEPEARKEDLFGDVTVYRMETAAPKQISDGRFDLLNVHWKSDVTALVQNGACSKYDFPLMSATGSHGGFIRAKALMIVESLCDETVIDGLTQVKAIACKDAGVSGNRSDVYDNILCSAKYFTALCKRYGHCEEAVQFVAYNWGPVGVQNIADVRRVTYARKIDFVLRQLLAIEREA